METFYNGLNGQTQTIVDASANGAILAKTYNKAYEILERMAHNNYQWLAKRAVVARRVTGVHKVDVVMTLTTQVSSLSNILKPMNMTIGANAQQSTIVSCTYCGEGHLFDNCPSNLESVYYVGNFNRNNNPYSNTYNSGWRKHSNFSWNSHSQNAGSSSSSMPNRPRFPLGFQQPAKSQLVEQSLSIEILLKEYMAKNDALMQNQQQ